MTISLNHTTNLRILFKNHSAQPLVNDIWAFFASCAIVVRHNFLWVSYLSILGGVFVMCHFCKVPLFSNDITEFFFCRVPFLLGVSDGAVLFL